MEGITVQSRDEQAPIKHHDRGIDKSLRNAAAEKAEARTAWLLEPEIPNFVRGMDGCLVDCGIVVINEDENMTAATNMERILVVMDKYTREEVLIPLEIKCIGPQLNPKRPGRYYFGVKLRPAQRAAVFAFIVHQYEAPNLVAVIPTCYLRSSTRSVNLFADKTNAFYQEWSPFVMPTEFLPASLRGLEEFYRGKRSSWGNPYNGILFESCKPQPLKPVQLLLPSPTSGNQDHKVLRELASWFRSHSGNYSIQCLAQYRHIGDFEIYNNSLQKGVVVELKKNLTTLRDGRLTYTRLDGRRHKGYAGHSEYFFTPWAVWDLLLLTLIGSKTNQAVLVSRDEVPRQWFEPHPHESLELQWTPHPTFLTEHLVTWSTEGKETVRSIETVLDRYFRGRTLPAQRRFSMKEMSDLAKQRGLHPFGVDPTAATNFKNDTDRRQNNRALRLAGEDGKWSPTEFLADQESWLHEQCVKHKYGHVHQLGEHPSGWFVFSPGRHSAEPPTRFEELALHTPMVYINFADIKLEGPRTPTDNRHPSFLLHATHGEHQSLYILNPLSGRPTWEPPHRFVVPSKLLNTKERQDINQRTIDHRQESFNPRGVHLVGGEAIDAFRVPSDQVVPMLQRLFECDDALADAFLFGESQTGVGVHVPYQELMTNKQGVLEGFMLLLHGRSFMSRFFTNAHKGQARGRWSRGKKNQTAKHDDSEATEESDAESDVEVIA